MTFSDIFAEAFTAIKSNKMRSGLTVLGIVIGIASVIAMISVGQGASNTIQSGIQSLGSNLILVTPGFQRTFGSQARGGRGGANSLTLSDVEAIRTEINTVVDIAPTVSGRYQVITKGANTNTSVTGVTASYANVRNVTIDQGDFVTDLDNTNLNKVAVLGATTNEDLFGGTSSSIGETIRINGIQFTVIGVAKASGLLDDVIYVPLSVAQKLLIGNNYVSNIAVQADNAKDMNETLAQITDLLLKRHHISDATKADFSAVSMSDVLSIANTMTQTLTVLLASIAGISLAVGGIGIMNMMLTNVTERTREIGLRKAIGATSNDISAQFLSESIILTFVGGILGIILGIVIAFAITKIGNIPTKVASSSILLAFGVSALIGVVFGYYPAKKAARLNPIDALRYE